MFCHLLGNVHLSHNVLYFHNTSTVLERSSPCCSRSSRLSLVSNGEDSLHDFADLSRDCIVCLVWSALIEPGWVESCSISRAWKFYFSNACKIIWRFCRLMSDSRSTRRRSSREEHVLIAGSQIALLASSLKLQFFAQFSEVSDKSIHRFIGLLKSSAKDMTLEWNVLLRKIFVQLFERCTNIVIQGFDPLFPSLSKYSVVRNTKRWYSR